MTANHTAPKLRPIEAFRRDGYCSSDHFAVLDAEIRALEAEIARMGEERTLIGQENDALKSRVAELERYERFVKDTEHLLGLVDIAKDQARDKEASE